MFFKKNKIKKTQTHFSFIPFFIGIISIGLVGFFGIKIVDGIGSLELQIAGIYINNDVNNPNIEEEQTAVKNSEIHSEDKNITNILLLGKGGGNHDAPELTDTIILASINSSTDSINLLSIPRDLWVSYPSISKEGKINQIYETFLYRYNKSKAIETLKSKITEITGQKIDYYVMVDFEGFIEIVDILGGVEVTVPENFVDYEYPDGKLGYTTFILRKGTWTLDGEVALKYARSRHSTSDFDRSLRQQQILKGIKDKVLSLGYIKDSKKIQDLFTALKEYIDTDLDIKTLVKIGLDFKLKGDKEIFSFNLNDTCFTGSPICSTGGFLYVPQRDLFGGQSVLLVEESYKGNISDYEILEGYMNRIFRYPEISKEKTTIAVYNTTSIPFLARSLSDVLKKYGFNIPEENSIGNIREKKFEKSILYYNGIDRNSKTLEILSKSLGIPLEEVESPVYSDKSINIEIILGNDFSEITYLEIE